ncbi:MAG TPA: flagellar basal body rod protein FlgB [Alphaproteobacteria bacterium]|nr:flagellar basal body rod protein FlgB [Alphaproteobacteria bacterium]
MDLNQLGLFRTIARRLDWLTQRQGVLAQNIANSDTPNYRPGDLAPFESHLRRSVDNGRQLRPAVTRAGHMTGVAGTGEVRAERIDEPYEVEPSGNAVNVEQQMMLVAETAMDHQLALNLYQKHVGMIRTALGRGSGR